MTQADQVLARHSLRRSISLVLGIGVILAGFQVILALAASTLQKTGLFGQIVSILPPVVRELLGPALAGVMSFAGIVSLGYFHVAVVAAVVGLVVALATEPAAEIESGFADFVLSRPVPRVALVRRSAAVAIAGASLVVAMMMAGTWAGSTWLAPDDALRPTLRTVVSLAVNLWALALCWGGIALAVAAASRRRAVAGSITGLAALALFLVDYLGRIWKPADAVAWTSPFRYFNGLELVSGRPFPLGHVALLLGIAVGGIVVALVVFRRRDL